MLWGQHRDIISGYGNYKKKLIYKVQEKNVCMCVRAHTHACKHMRVCTEGFLS